LVTGGTDGIGKEIALGLANFGHRVIIVGHNQEKGDRAQREIRQTTGNPNVEFVRADLGLVSETARLAEDVTRRFPELHYLVLSADVVRGRRELTSEGIESNFAINYLSRFVLIRRMLPLLIVTGRPGSAARIVLVSGAARNGRVYFDDVNLATNFGTLRAVGQFCQANDLLTVELARRLVENGQGNVTVNCLKRGVVKTNIRREFPWWMKWLVPLLLDPLIGQTAHNAAKAALDLFSSEAFERFTGALFLKIRDLKRITPSARTLERRAGQQLWQLSERLADQNVVR